METLQQQILNAVPNLRLNVVQDRYGQTIRIANVILKSSAANQLVVKAGLITNSVNVIQIKLAVQLMTTKRTQNGVNVTQK